MKVYVVAGLPGAGKSYYRKNNPLLSTLPTMDMAELRVQSRNDLGIDDSYAVWRCSMHRLLDWLAATPGDKVVEGVFSQGSASLNQLQAAVYDMGGELVYYEARAEFAVCAKRILEDFEWDGDEERAIGRMQLLTKLYNK